MAAWIGGLDGCRGGWAGVLVDRDDPRRWRAARFETLEAMLDGPERPLQVGIDVPIGLPERIVGGGRPCDLAARTLLGPARASVFPVPPRPALEAAAGGDGQAYERAKAAARAHSEPPRAFSIQCFNILPAIRAVDGLLRARPELIGRVCEAHPEVAFHRLNGDRPLGAGKRTESGLEERRRLLLAAGLPEDLVLSAPPKGVGRDDHLDAMAGLVVARDRLAGRARPLPDASGRDAHGLPMTIWSPGPILLKGAMPNETSYPVRDVARALVFDPDGRLLLIAYEATRPIPGAPGDRRAFWFMPGGGLEPGESHVEACRRELEEEIGVADAPIGPEVGRCEGPFLLFRQPRHARERYFAVRLPDSRVDTSRLAETEDNPVLGTRWWSLDELGATDERIEPAGLAALARAVVAGDMPEEPVRLRWQGA